MFVEDLKDLLNQAVMLSQQIGKDQDVIEVYNNLSCVDQICQDVVHEPLKHHRGVGETKEHNSQFKESSVGSECSLIFISFSKMNIIVPLLHIKLDDVLGLSNHIKQFKDKWQGIAILFCHIIDLSIVNDQPESTILLLDKEDS